MNTNIMVVEDENIVAKDIVNRLKNLGYNVCGTAAQGEDAIAMALREHPDLVLMDIMLRGEMDGIEAAAVITEKLDAPVIYLTAYADEKTLHRAKLTDAFGYLLKPFEERELHITIEMALFKHQMEHKLRESEEWLSAVLRSIGDAVIATDMHGSIRFMNPIAETLTGWSREEASNKPLHDVFKIVDEKTREPIPDALESMSQAERPHRLIMRSLLIARDGREIPVDDNASPIKNAVGEITGMVLVFRNVTERRRAESALRQSQSQLAGIVGSAMDAIITVDAEQNIIQFNTAAEKIFGCSVNDVISHSLDRLLPGRFREAHRKHIGEFTKTNVTRRSMGMMGSLLGLRASGEEFPIEASISQIEVGGKHFSTVILRDVTERNRMEEQLRQAQKMESVGTLASGIAHDFNNVLNNVLGFSMQLKKYINDEARVRKYIDTIERSAQRGAELASQLLSFARTTRRDAGAMDLAQVANEVVTSCRETFPPGVAVESSIPSDIWQIRGDHSEIYQVLLNLMVNARDAMTSKEPPGGKLTVAARNVVIGKDVKAQLFATQGNQCVELTVADTGTGIPEEIRAKVFDPFFTTKERGRGTGLGLSIVYNIVRAHHGTITLESEINKGTTFHLFFPAMNQTMVATSGVARSARSILLVDDEPAMQELGKELLEDEGYSVFVASNGEEAIDLYKKNQDKIELVILDLVMPGMDGGQVYAALKALNPRIKAFFCTGFISDQIIASLLEEQKLTAISKPFRPDQFLRTVREVLES